MPYALTFPCSTRTERLEVTIDIEFRTSVTDVLDNIYFGIAKHVRAFTYLTSWVLINRLDFRKLIIK